MTKKNRTLEQQMEDEQNFDVEDFLERVNSPEFREKIDKATEKILDTKFETGE